jgi:hypothetical protein
VEFNEGLHGSSLARKYKTKKVRRVVVSNTIAYNAVVLIKTSRSGSTCEPTVAQRTTDEPIRAQWSLLEAFGAC